MRGRKKGDTSKTKTISFRITEEQYKILIKNEWMKKDLLKQINDYINIFQENQQA